jgi:hypothetical protein
VRVRSARGSLVKVKTRAERESVDEAILVKAAAMIRRSFCKLQAMTINPSERPLKSQRDVPVALVSYGSNRNPYPIFISEDQETLARRLCDS